MDGGPLSETLKHLCDAFRVGVDYWDWQGNYVPVSAATVRSVLAALGVDASTDERASQALQDVADEAWEEVLPPTVVLREGWTPWVKVHLPHGWGVLAWLELEDGSTRRVRQVDHPVEPRWTRGRLMGEATFQLDGDLPLGWHTLHAVLEGGTRAASTVIVTPRQLELPPDLRDRRVWGVMTQLYQVRSRTSWGVGDLRDLASLADWAGRELGADYVLVNPLHAAEPVAPMEPSPYLPTTRRFANPVYLHVEDLPEYAALGKSDRRKVKRLAAKARALNAADTIDRDTAWRAKRKALRRLFDKGVRRGPGGGLPSEMRDWCAAQGDGLDAFATWSALAEKHGADEATWPSELRDPADPAVTAYRAAHADRVDFHRWLQWRLAWQLAGVQEAAQESGMALGVVHDLAVGVHSEGADAWALRAALARGVAVGAPPDQFNQLGQNWLQPPWNPRRLAELGYAPYRDMVRALLRDAGGLRVDHVIGLFRLWWVPEGEEAVNGAYVRYDHEALVGILVLEAQRAGAVVVGEDLGVVEPSARDYLRERGILGTSILWFEWDQAGLLPPERYRELCLATVTTHDLAPTAGFLDLAHVDLRERLGLLTRPVEEERAQERATIEAVRDALVERDLIAPDGDQVAMVLALHAFLAQTPSRMLGVALADLVGDRRIINQPGTIDEYPNWRVPLADSEGRPLLLEQVRDSPLARAIAALMPSH